LAVSSIELERLTDAEVPTFDFFGLRIGAKRCPPGQIDFGDFLRRSASKSLSSKFLSPGNQL